MVSVLLLAALALTAWFVVPALPVVIAAAFAGAVIVARPERGLIVLTWLLPFHILLMTLLFGGLGLPAPTVRLVAAWKEATIAALLVAVVVRLFTGHIGRASIVWLDAVVGGLGVLALVYMVAAGPWLGTDVPLVATAYGFRDSVYFSLLYFVGRATPEIARNTAALRRMFVVTAVVAAIGVAERFLVPPEGLVLLGAASYFQDFLGVAAFTGSNQYGLPDNYWTMIGSQLVRRVGSTYLSSQGFAIPFLILMPAATLWLVVQRRHWLARVAYLLLWVALILSITRTTIIACVLETLVVALFLKRWSLAALLVITSGTAIAGAVVALPALRGFLWETLLWETASSASHAEAWAQGLEAVLRHPLGVGLGMADQTAARFGLQMLSSDNQYLKFAVEMGMAGLALYIILLLAFAVTGARVARRFAHAPEALYGILLVAATLGIALNSMTAVLTNSMVLAYLYFWFAGTATTLATERRPPAGAPSR